MPPQIRVHRLHGRTPAKKGKAADKMKSNQAKVAPPADAKPSRETAARSGAFPVVAIGASAGGLEAFTAMLGSLESDTGMAFVLVQHLQPAHRSMLAEILSNATKMPVSEVTQGMEVAPNRVYVIPPNAVMTISEGALQLTKRSDERGHQMPIDLFMSSLAEERKSRAIGVILSGTASDGTRGVAAIKAEAGITFAQDVKSAKYDGMPHSAIASGAVDYVMGPASIARELNRISRHPYVNHVKEERISTPSPADGGKFSQVFRLLQKMSGADFSQYKINTIQRRTLRRMALNKSDSLRDYVKHLQSNPKELEHLYQDILIPVTNFFRDLEAFEFLKSNVFPAIVKDKANKDAIRIWAPGCSTGEETYSLAILLLEFLGDRASSFQVQLFGTDVNESGIAKARAGIYPESISEDVSPERLRRFFTKVEGGYRINKTIRELCVFSRQNLASDPPFSQMNLVACRNLLIYMGPALQKKVIPLLHYALKPSGFLMLGGSESVSAFPNLFAAVDKKHRIYSKKAISNRLHYDFSATRYPLEPAAPIGKALPRRGPKGGFDVQAEADRAVLKDAPVGVVINGAMEVVQFRGRTTPYLEPAPGRPSVNVLKMAREGLAPVLRAAISEAGKKGASVRRRDILFEHDRQKRILDLCVAPLGGSGPSPEERYFLILFEEVGSHRTSSPPDRTRRRVTAGTEQHRENARLKQELAATQESMRASAESEEALREEFQSANEEVLSANEELQSTNEELETSKEELQSASEELNTLNDELRSRNLELSRLIADLDNLITSVQIPVVMLDRDLRIRRWTPTADKLLNVVPTDVGRPVSDIRLNIKVGNLEQMVSTVMQTLHSTKIEVQDSQTRWHSFEIHPYKTVDNHIDGVVLALFDIDVIKKSNDQLKKSSEFFRGIINTVREPLLVLDSDLRVVAANRPFLSTFNVSSDDTIDKFLYRLGDEQWNIPKLRALLEEILPKSQEVADFEVVYDFPGIGPKTMLLNARRLLQTDTSDPLILLAIEDITERKRVGDGTDYQTHGPGRRFG